MKLELDYPTNKQINNQKTNKKESPGYDIIRNPPLSWLVARRGIVCDSRLTGTSPHAAGSPVPFQFAVVFRGYCEVFAGLGMYYWEKNAVSVVQPKEFVPNKLLSQTASVSSCPRASKILEITKELLIHSSQWSNWKGSKKVLIQAGLQVFVAMRHKVLGPDVTAWLTIWDKEVWGKRFSRKTWILVNILVLSSGIRYN